MVTDSKLIMNAEYNFYSNLYAVNNLQNNINYERDLINSFLVKSPKLNEIEKNVGECLIKNDDCIKEIKDLKNNKSPENDGLTFEFYKIFGGIYIKW